MTGKRLLVIDDEPAFLKYVRRIAESLGHEVTTTSNPIEFKDVYRSLDPNFIVVDIVMPGVDGIEILTWLAEQGCRAKVVVISGFNPYYSEFAKVISTARGLVSVSTFAKPIRASDLRGAIS